MLRRRASCPQSPEKGPSVLGHHNVCREATLAVVHLREALLVTLCPQLPLGECDCGGHGQVLYTQCL